MSPLSGIWCFYHVMSVSIMQKVQNWFASNFFFNLLHHFSQLIFRIRIKSKEIMWILMLKTKHIYDLEIGADPENNPDVLIENSWICITCSFSNSAYDVCTAWELAQQQQCNGSCVNCIMTDHVTCWSVCLALVEFTKLNKSSALTCFYSAFSFYISLMSFYKQSQTVNAPLQQVNG